MPRRPDGGFYTFISYTRREAEARQISDYISRYVDYIRGECKRYGYEYVPISIDRLHLNPDEDGAILAQHLHEALRDSDYMTMFVSPGYFESPWCMFEYGAAYALTGREKWGATANDPYQMVSHPRLRYAILPIVWKQLDPMHYSFVQNETLHMSDESGANEFRYIDAANEPNEPPSFRRMVEGPLAYLQWRYNVRFAPPPFGGPGI